MAFLPIFPLKLVVFPNENLNLHIFEPRYRELVADHLVFGIPYFSNQQAIEYGTEVSILEFTQKYPSGESDIKTKGNRRFKILNFYRKAPNKLYGAADIEYIDEIYNTDLLLNHNIITLIEELFSILEINKPFDSDPNSFKTFDVAHDVGFSQEQEYKFLTLDDELTRQNYMKNHLEKIIPTVKEMKRLQDRIKMNGHFKDIIPPNY